MSSKGKKRDKGSDKPPQDNIEDSIGQPQPMDPQLLRSKLQRLAWIRVVLGIASGLLAGFLGFVSCPTGPLYDNFNPNAYIGLYIAVFVFIATYYLGKNVMGIVLPQKNRNKLITQGIGGYFMMFIFFWILYNTIFFAASCAAII